MDLGALLDSRLATATQVLIQIFSKLEVLLKYCVVHLEYHCTVHLCFDCIFAFPNPYNQKKQRNHCFSIFLCSNMYQLLSELKCQLSCSPCYANLSVCCHRILTKIGVIFNNLQVTFTVQYSDLISIFPIFVHT